MNNFSNNPLSTSATRPWYFFIILIFLVTAGLLVGSFLGLMAVVIGFGIPMSDLMNEMSSPSPSSELKGPLVLMQGVFAFFFFIVIPVIYLIFFEKKSIRIFFNSVAFNFAPIALSILLVLAFMFVNAIFIEWNANVDLPDFLSGFEEWAQNKEKQAQALTKLFVTLNGVKDLVIAMIVVAIIPAVGEELLFRGLMQNQMRAITKNIHVAIWITGFLFAAFHQQFYGLVPRMLLGVLFGYLYYWSGSLLIPIIGHFVNNGFTVLALYFYQSKMTEFNVESNESLPISYTLGLAVIAIILTIAFRKYFEKRKIIDIAT